MRTKTLVLTALLGMAASPLFAQTNVYSVNAVGYVQISFNQGQYKMFCNPLNTTNNTIGSLIQNAPDFSNLYKWTGTSYQTATYASFLGGWDQPTITLNPGEGAFFNSNGPFTNTFVGEVLQGSLSNNVPVGYSIRSSKVPQAGKIGTDLGLAGLSDFDNVYQWTGSGYVTYTYASFLGGWNPSEPVLAVGESVFLNTQAGATWNRTFSVNN